MLGLLKSQFPYDLQNQTAVSASSMPAPASKHHNAAAAPVTLSKANSSHQSLQQKSGTDSEDDSFDEQIKFALFANKKNYGTMPVTATKQDRANETAIHEVKDIPSGPSAFSFLGLRI